MHIFVTRLIPEAGLALLRERAEVEIGQVVEDRGCDRGVLLAGAARADVLVSLLTDAVDREVLEAGTRLAGVATFAVGFDNVDVKAATALGLPVSNTPGVLTDTTADLTWALLLGAARRVVEGHRYMTESRYRIWGPNLLLGEDVSPGGSGTPKTLGILGYGRIGQAVHRRATGFEMRVLAHDPYERARIEATPGVEYAELDRLLAESDFVTIHTVLSPETRHRIGERELALMKPTAVLVNAARGPIVDEAALVRALRERRIAAAGLDVYEDEPRLAEGLAGLDNVVLLPHLGSASRETRDRMAVLAAEGALAHAAGERARHCVNPEVYETEAWRRRRGGP